MITKLRAQFAASAGISGTPASPHSRIPGSHVTCEATAA
jgi:hypothetical protein